jgi:tetratricopeptide (TPR) repeat protein
MAQMIQIEGRYNEAAELYQRLLNIDPNDIISMNNYAWILCEDLHQYNDALQMAEDALKKEPGYVDLLDTHGVICYRLGHFEQAVKDFKECIRLYPQTAPAGVGSRFHLGRVYQKLGQDEEAVRFIKEALDMNERIKGLSSKDIEEANKIFQQIEKGGG